MKLKQTRLILSVILGLFLISCANMRTAVKEDPYQAALYSYDQSLQWYTKSAETYMIYYKAADKQTQEKWKEKISPIFLNMKKVLDSWKVALNSGDPGADKYDQIKQFKSQILAFGLSFLKE